MPKTIATTKHCLQRIHFICDKLHGSPTHALTPANVNVRVVLAANMIVFRPTHVFESMGQLEQKLYNSAIPLVSRFECIADCLATKGSFQSVPVQLSIDFTSLLFEFLRAFKAWKVPDEAKLTCRIKHALIALYDAEEHLPPDEPDDSRLKIEFRTQIERLRSKLQQIAGPAVLRQFDADRKDRIPIAPVSGSNTYATLPGRMTNEQLAHELLYDPSFQLDDAGSCSAENPVFHRIRESFHQAFWDSLADDLKLATPCYVRVLRVLSEIRDAIVDIAGSRESDAIKEIIDIEFIKTQAELGAFGWDSCKHLVGGVVSVIQRVQAPHRDTETREKWMVVGSSMLNPDISQAGVFCKALEFLLDRVNALRIDAANTR